MGKDQMLDIELETVNGDHQKKEIMINDRLQGPTIFEKANHPVTLKFEEIVYKVKVKKAGALFKNKKSEEKTILNGVGGIVNPGELLAMLGPSGSGKTTLLTALGGRLVNGRLTGKLSYNGSPFSNTTKRNTGFVTQDDVLYPNLTVTETLVFTALLRLPNSLSKVEKIEHAEAIIAQLRLTKCKNSIIGKPFCRGVSGGERKRVSIGQEMLINPSLLFLDEPTSGLDSTTAQRIVSTLWELAHVGGRTIVMTIHQPSSRLFYMFHKVMLLSEGNPMYFGKGNDAMNYFATVGYIPSVAMNPADFLLDLANGILSDEGNEDPSCVKQALVLAFKNNLEENLKAELQGKENFHEGSDEKKKKHGRWPTTWWQQFNVLLRRGVKERKHDTFSGLKIFQVLAVSIFSSLLWWHTDPSNIQDQIGLLFFVSSFWGFYPLFQAIFTFPLERAMLEKERSSGMYKLSSYFMAMTVGDMPMELVLPTVFVTIIYWSAGLKPTAPNFFATLFTILLSVLVSSGLGLAIGAMVMDQKSATTVASVLMLSFLLAGGYYVQHVPKFIRWIKYISLSQYTYKLLLDSQFKAKDVYNCGSGHTCLVGDFPSVKMVGLGGEALAIVVLFIMAIGFRVLAYLALMRLGVTSKSIEAAELNCTVN